MFTRWLEKDSTIRIEHFDSNEPGAIRLYPENDTYPSDTPTILSNFINQHEAASQRPFASGRHLDTTVAPLFRSEGN